MGILVFISLYAIAAWMYPGGSDFDKNALGFSWLHNYWCNLLNQQAINGAVNRGYPLAVAAMWVLCTSLVLFLWLFAAFSTLSSTQKNILRVSGLLSMIVAAMLPLSLPHDWIINSASGLGLIATILTLKSVYLHKWKLLLYGGVFNIVLIIANNVLYYDSKLIEHLPVVQKISFLCFLIWFSSINIQQFKAMNAAKRTV